jgi:septal ring factor EnvC (AmiA/AmiB activator)
MTIHPDATVDECMEEISELEREIERQEKQLYRLGEELAKEKLEIERLRAERDEWSRMWHEARAEIERLQEFIGLNADEIARRALGEK